MCFHITYMKAKSFGFLTVYSLWGLKSFLVLQVFYHMWKPLFFGVKPWKLWPWGLKQHVFSWVKVAHVSRDAFLCMYFWSIVSNLDISNYFVSIYQFFGENIACFWSKSVPYRPKYQSFCLAPYWISCSKAPCCIPFKNIYQVFSFN